MGPRERNTGKILLVDDEETDLSMARNALEAAGYSVLTASSCTEALSSFESAPEEPSMAIVDIALPDGNGCDLAIAMLSRQPGLRVLFISGHVGSEVCRFYGLDVTALHFLRKPFTADELKSRVRQILAAEAGSLRQLKPKASTSSGY